MNIFQKEKAEEEDKIKQEAAKLENKKKYSRENYIKTHGILGAHVIHEIEKLMGGNKPAGSDKVALAHAWIAMQECYHGKFDNEIDFTKTLKLTDKKLVDLLFNNSSILYKTIHIDDKCYIFDNYIFE